MPEKIPQKGRIVNETLNMSEILHISEHAQKSLHNQNDSKHTIFIFSDF